MRYLFLVIYFTIFSSISCAAVNPYLGGYDITNLCRTKTFLEIQMKIRIDKSFSKDQKQMIKNSFKEWQKAINDMVEFSFYEDNISQEESYHWDCDNIVTIYNGLKNDWRVGPKSYENVAGTTFINSRDIFMFIDGVYFKRAILHEIGHILLGTYHSEYNNDIMYRKVTKNESLSFRDKYLACSTIAVELYPHFPEKLEECGCKNSNNKNIGE